MKTPQILEARKTQAETWQVKHPLRRYPLNFRQNFHTQAAQHLSANYLFKLRHAFHIYNKQGKKETTDTLLIGGDSETWWKSVGNKLGILANGIGNRVQATNPMEFTRKEE